MIAFFTKQRAAAKTSTHGANTLPLACQIDKNKRGLASNPCPQFSRGFYLIYFAVSAWMKSTNVITWNGVKFSSTPPHHVRAEFASRTSNMLHLTGQEEASVLCCQGDAGVTV